MKLKQLILPLLFVAAGVTTVVGCYGNVDLKEPSTFKCDSNSDCLDDFECKNGFCEVKPPIDSSNPCIDNDGDGYGDKDKNSKAQLANCSKCRATTKSGDDNPDCKPDCDDNNPNVNPGATEVCDNVDNDCNGTVDDPSPNCSDNLDCKVGEAYQGVCTGDTQQMSNGKGVCVITKEGQSSDTCRVVCKNGQYQTSTTHPYNQCT